MEWLIFSDWGVWAGTVVVVLAALYVGLRSTIHVPARDPALPPWARFLARRILLVVGVCALLDLSTVPNAFRHDDLDRLNGSQRAVVHTAIDHVIGCYSFSHVELHLNRHDDPRYGFTFRCEATVFGGPALVGEAQCAGTGWELPGWDGPDFYSASCL